MKSIQLNGKSYTVLKLLGKGKGGYSYLVSDSINNYVLKQMHHEPCAYYQFGDKLEAEINDYNRLSSVGINMPQLIAVDYEHERLLKEYINGKSIFDIILNDEMIPTYLEQIKQICSLLYKNYLNIDYFPTNFIVNNDILSYVDYECNEYKEEWNFENWGIKYWSKTAEFLDYVNSNVLKTGN